MKYNKNYLINLIIFASISFFFLSVAAFVVKFKKYVSPSNYTTKYPLTIMSVLRKSLSGTSSSSKYDHIINRMSKIDVLDQYFEHAVLTINGPVFREAVFHVFGLNLNKISDIGEGAKLAIYPEEIMQGLRKALKIENPSTETDKKIMNLKKAEVMDKFLETYNIHTYKDIIRIVNLIYGINLPGISSLEHSRISLYSKNQWLLRNDTDLFVVYTGKGDIDVKVYPTPYFIKQTGKKELPQELQNALINLGYRFNTEKNAFYYHNLTCETVSDSFKRQTLNAIRSFVN